MADATIDLLDQSIEKLEAAIAEIDDIAALAQLRDAEVAGKTRSGAIKALDARIAALQPLAPEDAAAEADATDTAPEAPAEEVSPVGDSVLAADALDAAVEATPFPNARILVIEANGEHVEAELLAFDLVTRVGKFVVNGRPRDAEFDPAGETPGTWRLL